MLIFQLLLSSSFKAALPVSRLRVHKRLAGNTAGTADPK